MKITFETDEVTGEWMCILWDSQGNMVSHTYAKTAVEAEAKMKAEFMKLFNAMIV